MTPQTFAFALIAIVAINLIAYILLAVAGFRQSATWGIVNLLVPLGSIVFAFKHWPEAKLGIMLILLSAAANGALFATNQDIVQYMVQVGEAKRTGKKIPVFVDAATAAKNAKNAPPREARDLAENEAPLPPVDPFATQRAAYVKHGSDLTALYQQLNTERGTLKPGSADVAAFNAKAARYQDGLKALAAEKAQLDALDHQPAGAAPTAGASPGTKSGRSVVSR